MTDVDDGRHREREGRMWGVVECCQAVEVKKSDKDKTFPGYLVPSPST